MSRRFSGESAGRKGTLLHYLFGGIISTVVDYVSHGYLERGVDDVDMLFLAAPAVLTGVGYAMRDYRISSFMSGFLTVQLYTRVISERMNWPRYLISDVKGGNLKGLFDTNYTAYDPYYQEGVISAYGGLAPSTNLINSGKGGIFAEDGSVPIASGY